MKIGRFVSAALLSAGVASAEPAYVIEGEVEDKSEWVMCAGKSCCEDLSGYGGCISTHQLRQLIRSMPGRKPADRAEHCFPINCRYSAATSEEKCENCIQTMACVSQGWDTSCDKACDKECERVCDRFCTKGRLKEQK